ncbi:MAG: hypothetical protein QXR63_05300 [Candidatus Bathyarchaeia archaeon]
MNEREGGGCSNEAFDRVLRACIDEVLSEVLGDVSSAVVLRHVGGASLSAGIEFFAEALERIFGEGASLLETLIVRRLYAKLGIQYDVKANYEFIDYVKEAEKKWRQQKGQLTM